MLFVIIDWLYGVFVVFFVFEGGFNIICIVFEFVIRIFVVLVVVVEGSGCVVDVLVYVYCFIL